MTDIFEPIDHKALVTATGGTALPRREPDYGNPSGILNPPTWPSSIGEPGNSIFPPVTR